MRNVYQRGIWIAGIALFIGFASPARSESVTVTPFSINPSWTEVYNDRIGNSRFFSSPNSDLVRVSSFVYPSRDSDAIPVRNPADGLLYQSTNGAATEVSVTHSSMGSLVNPAPLTFAGVTSGRGGGFGEFTRAYNRANAEVASLLDNWDATPFTLQITNNFASNGVNSITYAAPDYNKSAMPGFVTDVTLTGAGVNPRLDWKLPASGSAPTEVSIQVRRINAETADHTHITAATFVHGKTLDVSATSYSFSDIFSNASLPGFPTGLQIGQRYEIAVQLEVRENGSLKGRSRSFFELTPLAAGGNDVAIFLPSVGPNGVFKFDVAVQQGQQIALDPVVAVGYDYAIGAGDPLFRSVLLPSIGDGQYELLLWNGNNYTHQTGLSAGSEYFFAGVGVDRFRILGIEADAAVNPSDATAFITNVTFSGNGRFTGTMTPITVTVVPEPASAMLLILGLGMLGPRMRRRLLVKASAF